MMILLNDDDEGLSEHDDQDTIMTHPLLRKDTDATPAETWVSAMASVNKLVKEGIDNDVLLIFAGEASGVSRYNGLDDLWDPDGDCKIRLDSQDVCFDSKIIFESRSKDLISLISECVCEVGTHYRFNVPPLGEDLDKIGRYNLALRNFIATIMRKPLVGNTLVSALEDLQIMTRHIFGLQHQPQRAIGFVQDYVQELRLDNIAHRPTDVGHFLAWTERTRWARGFVESFAHCVGMLNCGVIDQESLNDDLSPTTRALLEHSCTHMHYNLAEVEASAASFGVSNAMMYTLEDYPGVAKSMLAFQKHLAQHYARAFGQWPPAVHQNSGHWLTRSLAQRLQQDFGNLYDLLVDTNVRQGSDAAKSANSFGCGLDRRQLLAAWDRQRGFNPMPHPDPKVPDYSATWSAEEEKDRNVKRSSLIPAVQKHRKKGTDLAGMYSRATNKDVYMTDFCKSFLGLEASMKHESVDTHDGRLGRWIIIYCMMQLLSRVAVEIQGLRYSQGVEYFLNADLDGTPPWSRAEFPSSMRPADARFAWAALFARAAETPQASVSASAQRRVPKPRFKVVHLADGRVMLEDNEGNVIFR